MCTVMGALEGDSLLFLVILHTYFPLSFLENSSLTGIISYPPLEPLRGGCSLLLPAIPKVLKTGPSPI